MLEGKNVNLRILEKDDIDFVVSYDSNRFWEKYNPIDEQRSKSEWTKLFDNIQSSPNDFEVFNHSEEGRNQDGGYKSSA